MNAPPAPLWRLLLACLPMLTRRAPFIRIPLYEVNERRQRNKILKDPRAAILSSTTLAQLSDVTHVLALRGIDWRELIGQEEADRLWARLAEQMRDDGGPV